MEIAICDLDGAARYVRLSITQSGQTWALEEIAIYGGTAVDVFAENVFTGYLGDTLDFTNAGQVGIVATDVSKKLADNNEVRLTPPYQLTELGDIVHSLTCTLFSRPRGKLVSLLVGWVLCWHWRRVGTDSPSKGHS